MENIISVKNVTKCFKEDKVLDNISVEFEKGKIHGLVGRNGSGKTVLMKCICGFVPVSSGEIKVYNKIVGKDIDIPKNLGIIIENPGFLPNYSGYNNLKLLAMIRNKIKKEDIENTIKMVGLDPKSRKHVSNYSLGMRQRLGIAQAMMEDPDIYILDEPMNGLDKKGAYEIRTLLLKLKERGKTIIIATHIMEDVKMLCDTVYKFEDGHLQKVDEFDN